MRIMLAVSLGIVGLSGLAACGESDAAFRARYRTTAVQACVEGGRTSNPANLDANRFCSCMVDAYMQAATTEQLKADRNTTEPPPAARAAIEQCARQQLGGQTTPAAGGTPPAGNQQAEAPESDAEENEQ